jgi:para-nitrobenzyl esterase
VAYVFGTLSGPKYNDTDREISAAIQEYWTNFAKTGDPNGGKLPRWPRFDPQTRAYLDFTDDGPAAKEGLRRQVCDLYAEELKNDMAQ